MMGDRPLVGPVFERKPTASIAITPKFASSGKSGFPVVQHRSKSAFTRGREDNIRQTKDEPDPHDWRRQISEENERRVESMTEEERAQEKREILERFGPGVEETLKRAKETKKRMANIKEDPEEGTPEDIRRRFFPSLHKHDPAVAWMESNSTADAISSALRFDLTGAVIPSSLVSTLPTHLGLHHHAEGTHAGYTLDDIFLLSRSSVPAQRATMLGVLSRIARRLGKARNSNETDMSALTDQADELRTRILAAGVGAMGERGSVGVRAVEVLWECIVHWDGDLLEIEGVELKDGQGKSSSPIGDSISSLPLQFFLPQIAVLLAQATLPPGSQLQLLSVLHRLAQHSNDIAAAITTTPNLISNIIQTFILTPIPPTQSSVSPDPSALQLLITLALSSRINAVALIEPADVLLRFITMLPPTSPYPTLLSVALLTCTLRLYSTFASYGLYAHIATTAAAPFAQLSVYVSSCPAASQSNVLTVAWAGLIEAWAVCATDPHRTTPSHEILWSQVVGWGWSEDVLTWRHSLTTACRDWEVWAAIWQAQAALLEGARVNGVRGGAEERHAVVEELKPGFQSGKERDVVVGAINFVQHVLGELPLDDCLSRGRLPDTAAHVRTVAAAIRLWLACIPPLSDGPLASPPFSLPFADISDICAKLVNHSLWSVIYTAKTKPHTHSFCRSLTMLLSVYLDLSRRLPGVSDALWMAQAFSILGRLIPGDEESGLHVLEQMTGMVDANLMASCGSPLSPLILEKDGIAVIMPFFQHAIQAEDVFIGPMWPSPRSILMSTTQRLPSGTSGLDRKSGLPLAKDWILSPLDHLLRSGSSSVFKSLPPSWDASETKVVRASLLFAKIAQEVLRRYSLGKFMLTREEAVFGCMKVFMLEHGQPQNDAAEEVFRDNVVEQLMENILEPFSGVAAAASSLGSSTPTSIARNNLEQVAFRFLGPSTPFYQYYTDFVALYDAVSFSHPLFARLLLPPTSMRYPPDYRKHLWNDYGHILKSVRTPFDQIIVTDIMEYLWPIEDDTQMIGTYLRLLATYSLTGFVRLLAIHHVACNIWPDLRQGEAITGDRGGKLLMAVVQIENTDAVREVVTYRQKRDGPLLLPPKCFDDGGWKELRLKHVEGWGLNLADRLEVLLNLK